jgi:hypothetical protein
MKEFEFVLNDEIQKVEEESEARKKFKRDDSDYTEDEEELVIIEHRPDPLKRNLFPNMAGSSPMTTNYVFFIFFVYFFVLLIILLIL